MVIVAGNGCALCLHLAKDDFTSQLLSFEEIWREALEQGGTVQGSRYF